MPPPVRWFSCALDMWNRYCSDRSDLHADARVGRLERGDAGERPARAAASLAHVERRLELTVRDSSRQRRRLTFRLTAGAGMRATRSRRGMKVSIGSTSGPVRVSTIARGNGSSTGAMPGASDGRSPDGGSGTAWRCGSDMDRCSAAALSVASATLPSPTVSSLAVGPMEPPESWSPEIRLTWRHRASRDGRWYGSQANGAVQHRTRQRPLSRPRGALSPLR